MKKLICALTVLAVSTAQADIIYVDDDAPLGGDGLSWNTAYQFLQDALADAVGATEIRVARGVYPPDQDEAGTVMPGDRTATFQLISGVILAGGYAGIGAPDPDVRDNGLYETILSGDLLGNDGPDFVNNDENSLHVVTGSGTDATAVLDGLTIRGGNADGASQRDRRGGALFNAGGSPTLVDCTIESCWALVGGRGVYNAEQSSPTLIDCTFSVNHANAGGGMYNRDRSTPTITGCVFSDNTALFGGAMYSFDADATVTGSTFEANTASGGGGAISDYSSSTFVDCIFLENTADRAGAGRCYGDTVFTACLFDRNHATAPNDQGGGALLGSDVVEDCTFIGNTSGSDGGAIAGGGPAMLTGCLFIGNSAPGLGGAIYYRYVDPAVIGGRFEDNHGGRGGAIAGRDSAAMIFNCEFSGNTADQDGGAIDNIDGDSLVIDSPVLVNCTFSGNSAGSFGGGMSNFVGRSTVINCTFSGNTADSGGGIHNSFFSSATVINCTFSGNTASDSGGGISSNWASDATVTNCVFWNNGPDEIFGPATVRYSDVEGGFPGTGNIDADPMFVDPDNGDFRLEPGSPCIDAGHNWGVPPDFVDLDADGDTAELIPFDLDGNPRFVADPADFDPGCGIPAVVDMGAYEFQIGDPFDIRLGDIDGDGVVGINDFLDLLARWGVCTEDCCLADLDLDGVVGITDFLILLASWG